MMSHIRAAVVMLLAFTVLTGVIYPLVVTGIAQIVFPWRANGSVIQDQGRKSVGSELFGQPFNDPKYFWGRPSATSPTPYNGASSTGSNLGPTNPVLIDSVRARVATLKALDPQNAMPVPVDLVTASGSGLDPDISVAAAMYQVSRVARLRGLSESEVRELVTRFERPRVLGVLGEPGVNVLTLNLALEQGLSMKGQP